MPFVTDQDGKLLKYKNGVISSRDFVKDSKGKLKLDSEGRPIKAAEAKLVLDKNGKVVFDADGKPIKASSLVARKVKTDDGETKTVYLDKDGNETDWRA